MKCPGCGREMQAGYLAGECRPVQWMPEGKRPSAWNFTTSEEGVTLCNRFSLLKTGGYRAEAYFCPTCQMIIAPTELYMKEQDA